MMLNGKIKYILVFFLLTIAFISPSSAIITDIDDTPISNSNTPVAQTEDVNELTNFASGAYNYIYDALSSDTLSIPDMIIGLIVILLFLHIGKDIKIFGNGNDILIFTLTGIMVFFVIIGAGIQSTLVRIFIRTIVYAGTLVFMYYAMTGIFMIAIGTIKHKFRR